MLDISLYFHVHKMPEYISYTWHQNVETSSFGSWMLSQDEEAWNKNCHWPIVNELKKDSSHLLGSFFMLWQWYFKGAKKSNSKNRERRENSCSVGIAFWVQVPVSNEDIDRENHFLLAILAIYVYISLLVIAISVKHVSWKPNITSASRSVYQIRLAFYIKLRSSIKKI